MSDKKDAVSIGITLSSQIIAASLTMIAVIGAFTAFVIDKRDVGLLYYFLTGGAFICAILSIVLGGKGIDKARKSGFNGTWSIDETKSYFNRQSIVALLSVILFSISVFVGEEKKDTLNTKIEKQEKTIIQLQKDKDKNLIQIKDLQFELNNLIKRVYDIEMTKDTVPNNG